MARGWESKSVESQIEDAAESRKAAAATASLDAEKVGFEREREGLLLSRTRVLHDLQAASNPRHREQVQAALTHLDEQLANLEKRAQNSLDRGRPA